MMERREPTLIPEWLKGVSGVGSGAVANFSQPILYQGESGVSFSLRHRAAHQPLPIGGSQGDHESQHFFVTSDRVALPATTRRILTNSDSINERLLSERESFSQARAYSNSGRSFSHIYDAPEREHDTCPRMQGDHDQDWDGEIDKDFSKDKAVSFGIEDEREREDRESLENGLSPRLENSLLRWPAPGATSKYEAETVPRRSQASRLHDNGFKKMCETGNPVTGMSSVSGSLATSMQKAAFDRNFPSLGSDEKQGGPQSSLGNVSVVGSRPHWQGPSRPDVGRALAPGLTTGGAKSNGVLEGWSFTALAEAPILNGNMLSNGLALNVPPLSATCQPSTVASTPVASTSVMNMAEALVQNSPRVRTPPQPFLESQKLEELALKQSRQLIPVTPSLPKTMGAADKGKPKVPGALKMSQPSKSCVLNSPHRSLVSVRSDTPKPPAQAKLLVLKSSKDGGSTVSNSVKPDGIITAQVTSLVNSGANSSIPGVLGTRKQKQFIDSKASLNSAVLGPSGVEGGTRLRPWDNVMMLEDKRPLIQTQNRSEFFNALRKKAASHGVSSFNYEKTDSSTMQKDGQTKGGVCEPAEDINHSKGQNNISDENGVVHNAVQGLEQIVSEQHASGDTKVVSGPADGLIFEESRALGRESTCSEGSEGFGGTSVVGGSEEEEAAFLRSLGWEENAEGGEALTEEEINGFYQMRAKSKLMHVRKLISGDFDARQCIGSLGSTSSGFSSSDSESYDEPRF